MIEFSDLSGDSRNPSALFIALWQAAEKWTPSERACAIKPNTDFERQIERALALSEAEHAYIALAECLGVSTGREAGYRGQVLAMMQAIDRCYYSVHPRNVGLVPSAGKRVRLPEWLLEARELREVTGSYWRTDDVWLVARGPLCRPSRHPVAANADTLADRFAALGVVASCLRQEGREISVKQKFVAVDAARGIQASRDVGRERVIFVPVAEDADDISKTEVRRGENSFVDFRVSTGIDPAKRIVDALSCAGTVDILLAPELVMSEEDADRLVQKLNEGFNAPRILVSGSGPTRATKDGQAFNEARVLNSFGAELVRQRKIWPAGITRELAISYGLSDPGEGQIFEDIASGEEIIVMDADGLGRCVILICQDLQSRPLADELIRMYQPDWVFIPVMDYGVAVGRWAHRRTSELSSLSQARFIVASSLTLARWLSMSPSPACGMAVGPSVPAPTDGSAPDDAERVLAFAYIDPSVKPGFSVLTWRSGNWSKTEVSITSHV
ncbi:hypothetical protein [Ensifer aridi]|uniref:hypothetical protein n=1 Tax=Ensifer aridi TaxID=1708715 RepID=UPI00111C2229|nr:hypothetical protein [Ensifer aridi]